MWSRIAIIDFYLAFSYSHNHHESRHCKISIDDAITRDQTLNIRVVLFFRNLTRGGTIMISREFTLEKKKLYRSYQQSHWRASRSQTFCTFFIRFLPVRVKRMQPFLSVCQFALTGECQLNLYNIAKPGKEEILRMTEATMQSRG